MRTFIILAFVALVKADAGGYSYSSGTSGGYASPDNDAGASISGGGDNTGMNYNNDDHVDYAAETNEFNKEFFTYTAPEVEFEDGKLANDLVNSLKKNLQVVFIKGPENTGLENAALNLAKSAIDSKTAIYVLNKQTDLSGLANKLQNLNRLGSHKPDVHFVKYRTPEDAIQAQRTIQQEYERLGGSTQAHNGGVAPVLDFASKVSRKPQRVQSVGNSDLGNTPSDSYIPPATSYLPPSSSNIAAPSPTYLPVSKLN